jgi:hypothetical protein
MSKLNIQAHQASAIQRGAFEHTQLLIPSVSQPSVGGYFVIDFKNKGYKLHNMTLQFNVSTNKTLNPTWFWIDHIDTVINGQIINTEYDLVNYFRHQLEFSDQERKLINQAAGDYTDITSLGNLWDTSDSVDVYLPLLTIFDQTHLSVITQNHEIQLRIYLKDIHSFLTTSSDVSGASVVINSCNLIAKVSQLPTQIVSSELVAMNKTAKDSLFTTVLHQINSAQSGVSNYTATLTSITGSVVLLFFVVRQTDSLQYSAQYNFSNVVKQFEILDSSGRNMVGGSPITARQDLLVLMHKYFPSSTFTTEGFITSGPANSNVFCYSFSLAPLQALKSGQHLTTAIFKGSEQLKLTFNSSLGSACQIDSYALCEAAVRQTPSSIQKILFH